MSQMLRKLEGSGDHWSDEEEQFEHIEPVRSSSMFVFQPVQRKTSKKKTPAGAARKKEFDVNGISVVVERGVFVVAGCAACEKNALCGGCGRMQDLVRKEGEKRSVAETIDIARSFVDPRGRKVWENFEEKVHQDEDDAGEEEEEDVEREDQNVAPDIAHEIVQETKCFFELKKDSGPFDLVAAVAGVVATLLRGRGRDLDKWIAKKQQTPQNMTAYHRKMLARDQAAGEPQGFDDRFRIMLFELVERASATSDDARALLDLHNSMTEKKSAISQRACFVTPRILIGGLRAAQNKEELTANNVGAIVSLGGYSPFFPDTIDYLQSAVRDRSKESMLPTIERAIVFCREHLALQHNVLIHCFGGRSRSSTVVCAVLMALDGLSMPEALAMIVRARPIVSPNVGFLKQIDNFNR